jgi:hypothetical protein
MKNGIQNELATAEDEFAWAEERKEVSLQLSEEVAGVYGFVHHTFENKYYQQKGQVWGPNNSGPHPNGLAGAVQVGG